MDYTLAEQLGAALIILLTLAISLAGVTGAVLYFGRNINTDSWPSEED